MSILVLTLNKYFYTLSILLLIGLVLVMMVPTIAQAQSAEQVVQAVLFYSPFCSHCHEITQGVLPPLYKKYAHQLEILRIDVSEPDGQLLYQEAVQHFTIPENRLGIPTLIIDDRVLVGSLEIADQFPGLVEEYLAQGGVPWPFIPTLNKVVDPHLSEENPRETAQSHPTVTPSAVSSSAQSIAPLATSAPSAADVPSPASDLMQAEELTPTWRDRLAQDPLGNAIAIIVLFAMLAAVLRAYQIFRSQDVKPFEENLQWLIPILCVVGLVVAGYLAYVETTLVAAVCGPVGDCNTVQQSEYARLFGILPIGILGIIGYTGILIAWVAARYAGASLAKLAKLALFMLTTAGTLFSIYLTFLEPFVIGATCAWCLTSALLMTLLMIISVRPAKIALHDHHLYGQ